MSEFRHRHPKAARFHANCAAKRQVLTENAETQSKTALILGGGAPNSALMAGAVAAFQDRGIDFDVISTSGAGGLVGLLWKAPKDATPAEALRNWVDVYVSDSIYSVFPVDYKVFFKPGAMADAWRAWLNAFPGVRAIADEHGDTPLVRLWSDLCELTWASLSPSSLNSMDVGLCARVPWADQLVDFSKVKDINSYFYLNAYNVSSEVMDNFTKDEITLDHFKAAFAFPFIYGPYKFNGDYFYEGASHDCLNFENLLERHPGIETVVVFDVLGLDSLIRVPRDLYDSWVLSMIIPLVKVAEDNLELFALKANGGWRRSEGAKTDLLVMPFDVPEEQLPYVLDWSLSNGQKLFDVGYDSALKFLEADGSVLQPRETVTPMRRRGTKG